MLGRLHDERINEDQRQTEKSAFKFVGDRMFATVHPLNFILFSQAPQSQEDLTIINRLKQQTSKIECILTSPYVRVLNLLWTHP